MSSLPASRRLSARLPFPVLLLSAIVAAVWAVRLLSPLPEALPAAPLAIPAPVASHAPGALWQSEPAVPIAGAIKILALIGSPSGNGRAVFEVDGATVAGNTGESPMPGWRIVAVRPDAVDLEIDGRIRSLSQPLPVAGQETSITR